MRVLRLRQLSDAMQATLRLDVPLDKLEQRHGVGIGSKPTARMRQLAGGTRAFAGLVSIAGGSEVMEAAYQLLLFTRKPEDGG
jgi:hypothetical protein